MRRKILAVAAVVVAGVLFFGGSVKGEPMQVEGRVVGIRGVAPVRVADRCTVAITPESKGGFPCRVSVTCGGQTLYGGPRLGGYAKCTVREGRYASAVDDELSWRDGDPALDLEVAAGQVVVRDSRPPHEVVIAMGR